MKTMLMLSTSPALEEDMVDYLLEHPGVEGFTSLAAYGHGSALYMSVTEQVAGRRKRIQFQIILETDEVESVTSQLADRVGQDIVFWQVPVSGLGRT
ncbi:MAG: DUF3240 family protein [Pseudohongiella sp.]|nr:DUF3240 family protein [Pseudohongiella sp.]MDP2127305.1 DUF3240 family protein [Pseudohongiella sp.]